MTEQAQNEALLKWMGYTNPNGAWLTPDGKHGTIGFPPIDLDLLHEAAMKVRNESPLGYVHYAATLTQVVTKFNSELEDRYSISAHDATIGQRREALLRTLGLWEKEK